MKKTIITILLVIIYINIFAQWFIETGVGISSPIETSNSGLFNDQEYLYDEINDNYFNNLIPIKFNIIKSPFISIKGGYLLNNKWEFSTSILYRNNLSIKFINHDNKINRNIIIRTNNNIETVQTHSTYYYFEKLSVSPSLAYNFWLNKKLALTPMMQFDISLNKMHKTDSLITKRCFYDTGELIIESIEINQYKFPNYLSLSNTLMISSGINVTYSISDRLTLRIGGMFDLLKQQYTPIKQIRYYQEKIINGVSEVKDDNEYIFDLQGSSIFYYTNTWNVNFSIRYYIKTNKTSVKNE